MKRKTARTKWCIIRENDDLRTAIRYQMEKRGYNVSSLARELDITRYRLSLYLNHKNSDINSLPQIEVMRVAMHLGIVVTLNIKILDDVK